MKNKVETVITMTRGNREPVYAKMTLFFRVFEATFNFCTTNFSSSLGNAESRTETSDVKYLKPYITSINGNKKHFIDDTIIHGSLVLTGYAL